MYITGKVFNVSLFVGLIYKLQIENYKYPNIVLILYKTIIKSNTLCVKIIFERDHISRKYMIIKIHLETSGAILENTTGSVTFKKDTKYFRLINFSHSKCSEIAFMENKT